MTNKLIQKTLVLLTILILGNCIYATNFSEHDHWYVTCINNSQYTVTLKRSGDCTGDAYWDETFYLNNDMDNKVDDIVVAPGNTVKFITREEPIDDPGTCGHEDKFMNLQVWLNQESSPRAFILFKEHVQMHFLAGGKRETHAALKDANSKVLRDNYRIHTHQPVNFTITIQPINIDEHPYIQDFISFKSAGKSELDYTVKNMTNKDMWFWTGNNGRKLKIFANRSVTTGLTMADDILDFHCSLNSASDISIADFKNNNIPTTRITDIVIQKDGDGYRASYSFNSK